MNPTPVLAAALVCPAGATEPVAASHQRRLHGSSPCTKRAVRPGIAGIEKSGLNGSLAFAGMTLTGSPSQRRSASTMRSNTHEKTASMLDHMGSLHTARPGWKAARVQRPRSTLKPRCDGRVHVFAGGAAFAVAWRSPWLGVSFAVPWHVCFRFSQAKYGMASAFRCSAQPGAVRAKAAAPGELLLSKTLGFHGAHIQRLDAVAVNSRRWICLPRPLRAILKRTLQMPA